MSASRVSTPIQPTAITSSERQALLKPLGGDPNQFKDILGGLTQNNLASVPVASPALKFSAHAIERMQARGVRFSPADLQKIESAVGKAASKGAKETLVLTDSSALIVSAKNNTVVTVMDKNALKEKVFTGIDSTVVV